jgi:hypothetical protein
VSWCIKCIKPNNESEFTMSVYRFIYWRKDMDNKDGMLFANVHFLVGYNQRTITDYKEMADELRKTFPQATDAEIHCGSVQKSTYCQNFSLITWNAHIPAGDYPGWHQVESGTSDYFWS